MLTSTAGGLRPPPSKDQMKETWLKAAAAAHQLGISESALCKMRYSNFIIEGQHWARGGIGPTDPIYYLPELINERLERNANRETEKLSPEGQKFQRVWRLAKHRAAKAKRQEAPRSPILQLQQKPPAVETAERLQGELLQMKHKKADAEQDLRAWLREFCCAVTCAAEKLNDHIIEFERAA